jgi:pseudouridine-5'-phosphate glycosidase
MLSIDHKVAEALRQNAPVVALESTLIAHGMPWPVNLETGLEVEQLVREGGAVPATVAVVGGKLKVGLSADELEQLARKGPEVIKCSSREIASVALSGQWGATTVAGTLHAARLAGIAVMATGGIGGVHRGFSRLPDVSADLPELARSSLMLVSAGAKSLLDLPATLEYLETLGVPVLGYGTREFPAFYTRHSGLGLALSADHPDQVASLLAARRLLQLEQGILVANPVPAHAEAELEPVQAATERALREAEEQGIQGARITPFVLARVAEWTGGESLRANVELIRNNARLGAQLALAWCRQEASLGS